MAENKGKHLTQEERHRIAWALREGYNFTEIGKLIGKDASTVSKEVKQHRYLKRETRNPAVRDNPCAKQETCRKRNICERKGRYKCSIPCRKCLQCHKFCSDFKPITCEIAHKAPHVCNGCERYRKCKLDKYIYSGESAQREYKRALSVSRQGVDMSKDELTALDALVSTLILKGQPAGCFLFGVSPRETQRAARQVSPHD